MRRIETISFIGETIPPQFISSSIVCPGVVCDVYQDPETLKRDIGVIYIDAGFNTEQQRVLSGDETIEGYISGTGVLTIQKVSGEIITFEVGPETEGFAHTVEVGEIMQWQAIEDLVVYEVCYPPYEDGRFENISLQLLKSKKVH